MLSWCNMRWSRSGAAAAVVATAGFVWGCSGSPDEGLGTDAATPSEATTSEATPSEAMPSEAMPSETLAPASSAGPSTRSSTEAPSPVAAAPNADRPIYHVPVPAELEPYSNFELGDLRLREHGSEWELEYTLPELLVGERQELSFRGSAIETGELQLRGDTGQVSCRNLGGAMRCDEVLSRVQLDRDKLQRSFASLPVEESAARWAVAERFSDDPIGVLTFPAQAD